MKVLLLLSVLLGSSWQRAPHRATVTAQLAPGDTLAYTVTWDSVRAATVYDFAQSVTGSNTTWSAAFGATAVGALPASGATGGPGPVGLKLFPAPLGSGDSATFTFSYRARRVPARSARDTSVWVATSWKWYRALGVPKPARIDSSTTVGVVPVARLDIAAGDSSRCTRDGPTAIRCTHPIR